MIGLLFAIAGWVLLLVDFGRHETDSVYVAIVFFVLGFLLSLNQLLKDRP